MKKPNHHAAAPLTAVTASDQAALEWPARMLRAAVSAAAWELGTVVKLFRKHTGLSQAGVARMVNIDQAEVSRLERGLKQIRDRRQFVQWTNALGVPEELLGLLPAADPHIPASAGRPGTAGVRAGGYAALPEGPGQLLLPAGRSVSATALPVLTLPAASFLGDSLRLDSRSSALETSARTRRGSYCTPCSPRALTGRWPGIPSPPHPPADPTSSGDTRICVLTS
ncbi:MULTISPECIES: helix-turn-helix transcriptional regulator [Streptomyces]|uniref:Helix-turn-helix transcriptional regulator n=1 Tax=Streptomyces edwardsiae TaxID=3075527 RepID=A0ABU2PSE8_9ACTN|nr:helix-turn-helix transcriptional regulator [Streptomyces sp. DSM 41636]MDT0395096.1 helix-turn-helix transcriptional regulator [Streptomyces sp. DSM 41636]